MTFLHGLNELMNWVPLPSFYRREEESWSVKEANEVSEGQQVGELRFKFHLI